MIAAGQIIRDNRWITAGQPLDNRRITAREIPDSRQITVGEIPDNHQINPGEGVKNMRRERERALVVSTGA